MSDLNCRIKPEGKGIFSIEKETWDDKYYVLEQCIDGSWWYAFQKNKFATLSEAKTALEAHEKDREDWRRYYITREEE